MGETLVVNTGPIIALARADALFLLEALPLTFLCPQEVQAELEEGAVRGHVVASSPGLHFVALETPLQPVALAVLDMGEAAVIQLALERSISHVCLDDWKGRRAATAVGLHVTGSLGLFIRAKSLGIIPEIYPFIERARREGVWYEPELVRRVLEGVQERVVPPRRA